MAAPFYLADIVFTISCSVYEWDALVLLDFRDRKLSLYTFGDKRDDLTRVETFDHRRIYNFEYHRHPWHPKIFQWSVLDCKSMAFCIHLNDFTFGHFGGRNGASGKRQSTGKRGSEQNLSHCCIPLGVSDGDWAVHSGVVVTRTEAGEFEFANIGGCPDQIMGLTRLKPDSVSLLVDHLWEFFHRRFVPDHIVLGIHHELVVE